MIELLGILLVVQGVGGLVNRIAGSGSESWFVQLHLLPDVAHIPVSIAMGLAGAVLATLGSARRKKNPS
ncbi:hypothetical protein DI005_15020 [Prauserella sp. PE36]|uniref:Uncharacterized protein n=1 Tax=Prauserella endophytica TaxID=1592324 RepID=A0ABY2S2E0_9PSEU|nr:MULTISPECIES: hypothetical protein [Prauserella]RBM19642.1 hypothetical protein DI005_15020 [Prauserella sp. PE36]TKG69612.1 hypothetical protein FCN18_19125 [Prauserella endophytica]